jgi:hypothetical protein
VNVADGGSGHARWVAAGRPIVPSLAVDGRTEPVLHVSQLAGALGLAWETPLRPGALAADTVTLLGCWAEGIARLGTAALAAPTPSRSRSLRNLTVNVHHPFELLPGAWRGGSFPWEPERDDEREAHLADADDVRNYASRVTDGWSTFVATHRDELDVHDPVVGSPRGQTSFSVLLDTQRWHAAYHLRQLEHVTGARLLPTLEALVLPAETF